MKKVIYAHFYTHFSNQNLIQNADANNDLYLLWNRTLVESPFQSSLNIVEVTHIWLLIETSFASLTRNNIWEIKIIDPFDMQFILFYFFKQQLLLVELNRAIYFDQSQLLLGKLNEYQTAYQTNKQKLYFNIEAI